MFVPSLSFDFWTTTWKNLPTYTRVAAARPLTSQENKTGATEKNGATERD
jgi:hypothetical protein